jgi:hypothetical protein
MGNKPPIAPTSSEFPKVYDFIADQKGDGLLEYPMYTWASKNNGLQKEFFRMYYSLKHKKNIVNGGSGFMPTERQYLIGIVNSKFPETEIVSLLSDMGVKYVIVHKSEISNLTFKKINEWGRELLIYDDENGDFVYKLP